MDKELEKRLDVNKYAMLEILHEINLWKQVRYLDVGRSAYEWAVSNATMEKAWTLLAKLEPYHF